jgi:hypothetical protein
MRPFDDVADRLTERLKPDPELRAEVANELKGHLEASAREFLSAGRSEEEAWREAVRAIGDEREVADGLWEGNRNRMTRRRVGRWVVGGTLLTAAGVGTVAVAWGAVISVAMVLALFAGMSPTPAGAIGGTAAQRLARYVRAERVAQLSPRDRAIFDAWEGSPEERAVKARALAETASGEDRKVFWANYATQMMVLAKELDGHGRKVHPEALAKAVAVMEEGKRAEPGNGFYALLESALLLNASTEMVVEPEDQMPGFGYERRTGEPERVCFDRYTITDPAAYARGLAQFHEAAEAKYVESHALDLSNRRLGLLPAGTRLADEVIRAQEEIAVSLSYLNDYRVGENVAGARAIELAKTGNLDAALGIVRDQKAVARMVAAQARPLIELLVAAGMYTTAVKHEAMVYQAAGDRDAFAQAVGTLKGFDRLVDDRAQSGPDAAAVMQLKRASGVVGGMYLPTGTDPKLTDPAPERRAEYAVADQLGVSVWAGMLVAIGLSMLAGAAWTRVRAGRWPGVMFVGWRRLVRVVIVAVGAPVGLYAAYAWTIGGRELGASIGADRLAVEYAVVGGVVLILLRMLGERAIGRRTRELGEPWQPTRWGRTRVTVGFILAAAAVTYLVAWHVMAANVAVTETPTGGWGFLLAAVLAGYGLSWLSGIERGIERRKLPRWVGPVVVTIALIGAVVLLGGDYAYRTGRLVAESAGTTCGIVAGLIAVALVVRELMKRRGATMAGRISYALSMGSILLTAAVVLVGLAGLTARTMERRAVARMESTGVIRLDQEVKHSRYQAVRDKILAGAADRRV